VLAVITILAILIGLAALSVTRYRKEVDEKEIINLHSALETSFNNYRTVLAQSGKELDSNILLIEKNTTSAFDKYISDLSYNGERLDKNDIDGSSITLTNKSTIIGNQEYINDVQANIPNFASLSTTEKNKKMEEQFIIDATCATKGDVINPGETNAQITKECMKTQEGEYMPSNEDLICIKLNYKGTLVIDDKGETDGAKVINKLCKYASNTRK